MKNFLATLALLVCGFDVQAATVGVATCPSAAIGAAFGSGPYPGCGSGTAIYVTALSASSIVADLSTSGTGWKSASSVGANDLIWTNTPLTGGITTDWVLASKLGLPISATPVPPTPPTPPTPPPSSVTYSATISWTAPPLDVNGNMTAVTGFNIYEGTSASTLAKVGSVGPTVLTYVLNGVPAGPLSIAVTAVNAQGEGQLVNPLPSVPESVLNLAVVVGAQVTP